MPPAAQSCSPGSGCRSITHSYGATEGAIQADCVVTARRRDPQTDAKSQEDAWAGTLAHE